MKRVKGIRERKRKKNNDRNRFFSTIARTGHFCNSRAWKIPHSDERQVKKTTLILGEETLLVRGNDLDEGVPENSYGRREKVYTHEERLDIVSV